VAGYAGLLLATPTVLYEVVAYVLPGLTRSERRLLAPIIFGSSILFYLGCAACAAVSVLTRNGLARTRTLWCAGMACAAALTAWLHVSTTGTFRVYVWWQVCAHACTADGARDQAALQQTACSLVLAPMGGCHCMTQILRAQAAVLVRGADAGGAELLCQLCGRRGRVAVVDRPVL